MAGPDGNPLHALELLRAMQAEPHAFGFFQALRSLECRHPELPRVGHSVRPAEDPIRLGEEPYLEFAPATLASCEPGTDGRPWRLLVRFFGLLGPNGPLPLHLTDYARDRIRSHGDRTLARFLDMFHHRLLCLFYRAWADAQPTVQHDRPALDRFASYVASLFGLGMPSLRDRNALPDLAMFHYAGLLACQTRHADGLRALLSDYFRIPVRVVEFVGRWVDLPAESLCRLGHSPATGGLGSTAVIGNRVWNCTHTIRVVCGPLGLADFRRLLPGGDSLRRLTAAVRNYVGDELAWEVQLILKQEEVPRAELGRAGQLGWTTWLACRERLRDPEDLVLRQFEE